MARAVGVPLHSPRALPTPGDTICGEILLERLASASVGAEVFQPVFAARELSRDEPLWLTVVDGMFTPTSVELSSFMAGANALLGVRHPSLVRVTVVDREEDFCVVGYEQLPGAEPLADLVVRGGSRRVLARAAVEIARGLAYLHRHALLHGALSTGSVFLWEGTPMLWEYGLAALCDPAVLGERARSLGGDVVAPEVLSGLPLTPAADVFAWGAVMASIATGKLGSGAVTALMEGDVDPGRFGLLLGVVRQALAPDPGLRPRDGVHLLELLQRSLSPVDPNTELDEPQRASGGDDALRELTLRYLGEVRSGQAAAGPTAGMAAGMAGTARGGAPGAPRPPGAAGLRPGEAGGAGWISRAPQRSASGWLRPATARAPDGGLGGLFEAKLRYVELDHGVRKRTVLAGRVARPRPPDHPPPPSAAAVPTALDDEQETPPEGLPLPHRASAPPDRGPPAAVDPIAAGRATKPSERETPRDLEIFLPAAPGARVGGVVERESNDELPPLFEPDRPQPVVTPPGPGREVREPFRMPRTPGPHGPPAWLMSLTLAAGAGLLAIVATLGASSARGGLARLLGAGAAASAGAPEDGGLGDEGGAEGSAQAACPRGMAEIVIESGADPSSSSFCIDRAEYPGLDRVPAVDVDLAHAAQACEVRGHALCTERQWERACRGRASWRYPYGPRHEPGRCRVGDESAAPGKSGADPHCTTPEGVLDLVGNVAEWTADGTVRGGSVRSDEDTGCSSRRTLAAKTKAPVVGFRCCTAVAAAVAEPSAAAGPQPGGAGPDGRPGDG